VFKEIIEFLRGSEGFIYMSFGAFADIASAPIEFQNIFHNVFVRRNNVRFIWKRSGGRPAVMSDNIYTSVWLPQKDILSKLKTQFRKLRP
jgi:hypothetical protein